MNDGFIFLRIPHTRGMFHDVIADCDDEIRSVKSTVHVIFFVDASREERARMARAQQDDDCDGMRSMVGMKE